MMLERTRADRSHPAVRLDDWVRNAGQRTGAAVKRELSSGNYLEREKPCVIREE
jgi:hypothetical protein